MSDHNIDERMVSESGLTARRVAMHDGRTSVRKRRRSAMVLRWLTGIVLVWSYVVLTQARYDVQGLRVQYFRVTTSSDLLSLGYILVALGLLFWRSARGHSLRLGRAMVVLIFALVILWLDYGVRRMDSSEFSPVAAVLLLFAMCFQLSLLIPKRFPGQGMVRRGFRIFFRSILILVGLFLVSFSYSFLYPTYSNAREIAAFRPDAGVVLGAAVWSGEGLGERPSPTLQQRIDVANELLEENVIPRIVVTGASAPGEEAEGEVAQRALIAHGVDSARIITETDSHSTLEQVRYLSETLHGKQGWDRFVIISDQYHLARVVDMCHFAGLRAIGSPSRIVQPAGDLLYYRSRESLALLAYWLLGK